MVNACYFPDVFQLTTLHPTRTNVHVVELKVDDLQVGHKQDHLFRNTLRGSGSLFSDSQVVDAVQLPKQDEVCVTRQYDSLQITPSHISLRATTMLTF